MSDSDPFLIRLEDCSVRLGPRLVLSGLTWTLRPGEHWLVLGPNGAGKSTLLRLLRGDIALAQGLPGRRVFGPDLGPDGLATESPLWARERVGLASAEVQDRHVRPGRPDEAPLAGRDLTGLEMVVTGLRDTPLLYSSPTAQERARARQALTAVGAAHLAEARLLAMSRGQARLAVIARALAGAPAVLLCDEILNGLDRAARAQVTRALAELSNSLTLVLAVHRADEVPDFAGRALLLGQGRILAAGPRAEVAPPSCLAQRPCPARAARPGPGPNAGPAAEPDKGPPFLVRIQDADLVRDGRQALSGLSLTIEPGQRWAVFGKNGAGKSSLVGLMTAELRPMAGTVHWFGQDGRQDVRDVRCRLGLVSPELQAAFPARAQALDTVLSGFLATAGLPTAGLPDRPEGPGPGLRARARAALAQAGLEGAEDEPVERLSYGQARRLLIARALVHEPDLLLLDEAEAGLDGPSRAAFRAVVEALARAGQAMVWVSHHLDELPPGLTHGLLLEHGRAILAGPLDQVLPAARGRLG